MVNKNQIHRESTCKMCMELLLEIFVAMSVYIHPQHDIIRFYSFTVKILAQYFIINTRIKHFQMSQIDTKCQKK